MSDTPLSFDDFIQHHEKPILADFWAEWCGPCKMLEPILINLAREWKERITVIRVNTEKKPDLALRFTITGIPTLILFSKGAETHRITGVLPLLQLKNELIQFL
jgi:thioredoxin 1